MKYIVAIVMLVSILCLSCIKNSNSKNICNEKGSSSSTDQGTTDMLSMDLFVGKWMLLNPDGSYYNDQYLVIAKSNDKYLLNGKYQNFIYSGELQKKGTKYILSDPINGMFSLWKIDAKDPVYNGAISLNLIGAGEDILCGYYQNIELLESQK